MLQTARSVYDVRDVRLDPFSSGLQSFTRMPARELATLRARALELLRTLGRGSGGPTPAGAISTRPGDARSRRCRRWRAASSSRLPRPRPHRTRWRRPDKP
jgi:hypothetical protein